MRVACVFEMEQQHKINEPKPIYANLRREDLLRPDG
jgi:hypothetical protein